MSITDDIVLFGSGEIGRRALHWLREHGKEPACFADSRRKGSIDGIPVKTPDEALSSYPGARWVASVLSLPASIEVPEWIRSHNLPSIPLGDVLPPPRLSAPYRFGPHHGRIPNPAGVTAAHRLLADAESITELRKQNSFYLRPNYDVPQSFHPMSELYFPEFIGKIEQEVFMDCGAADGDSIDLFLQWQPKPNWIIAIEPDCRNFLKLRHKYPWIHAINCAVSDVEGELKFNANGDYTSRLSVNGDGDTTVPVHRIDDLSPRPTFIKMDIEGFEPEALWGARGTLRDHKPVLAVCCYHDTDHFWKIPTLIHSLQPDYRLFFRRYATVPFELILYAVPSERLQ